LFEGNFGSQRSLLLVCCSYFHERIQHEDCINCNACKAAVALRHTARDGAHLLKIINFLTRAIDMQPLQRDAANKRGQGQSAPSAPQSE
jgi:hypothetical protein